MSNILAGLDTHEKDPNHFLKKEDVSDDEVAKTRDALKTKTKDDLNALRGKIGNYRTNVEVAVNGLDPARTSLPAEIADHKEVDAVLQQIDDLAMEEAKKKEATAPAGAAKPDDKPADERGFVQRAKDLWGNVTDAIQTGGKDAWKYVMRQGKAFINWVRDTYGETVEMLKDWGIIQPGGIIDKMFSPEPEGKKEIGEAMTKAGVVMNWRGAGLAQFQEVMTLQAQAVAAGKVADGNAFFARVAEKMKPLSKAKYTMADVLAVAKQEFGSGTPSVAPKMTFDTLKDGEELKEQNLDIGSATYKVKVESTGLRVNDKQVKMKIAGNEVVILSAKRAGANMEFKVRDAGVEKTVAFTKDQFENAVKDMAIDKKVEGTFGGVGSVSLEK